jgi:hypothetical protein
MGAAVNAKPPLGVYAVAVKTIASGPDKIVSGYQASKPIKRGAEKQLPQAPRKPP